MNRCFETNRQSEYEMGVERLRERLAVEEAKGKLKDIEGKNEGQYFNDEYAKI